LALSIFLRRTEYGPFEYQKAYEYWFKQQSAHWLHSEINLSTDLQDWNSGKLTTSEKQVIGQILKGFTQAEIVINDYWSRRVTKFFCKPEIIMMANAFSNMETIHAVSYALLNETLGLDNYKEFIQDPTTKAKLENLINTPNKSKSDILKSLAVFSAFAEGVSLFSSFIILLNFSRFNKLKGTSQIIKFSVRDESLHSEAGCWLFREAIKENPELFNDDMKKHIYEAARVTIQLEDDFIDKAFELGPIEGLDPKDLKMYLRFRANAKLNDLGLKNNWKNIDMEAVERITSWSDILMSGITQDDFFATQVSDYSRGSIDWGKMYE
jgi:ribonucleoside-diphosphate reductase beta chain